MNKKLICLLLSVIMLMSVLLTSCSQKDDDEALEDITEKASASAVTLSMYLMSEAEISAEQEKAMEMAVNEITMAKFKAKVDLTFLTADKYYAALEENLKLQAENAHLYYTEDEEELETEPETEKDELGIETLKYPALRPNQVDIFYFSGYDKYVAYQAEEYLNMLDESVSGESKELNAYLSPTLMKYMKSVNDGIYAIPNNRPLGEYTYLLLNKNVLGQMYYDTINTEFTSLTCDDVQQILSYVASTDLKNTYVPLHSFTGEVDVLNYQYWGVDENGFLSDDFSILGGAINPAWDYGAEDSYSNVNVIFDDPDFKKQYEILEQYRANGYYNETAVTEENKDFAVGYIKGGKEIETLYGDKYEIVPVATPKLNTKDLYQDMFGVSAYTVDLNRSMSVLTYLNTNEEFRNLFAYGIEGENYEIVESNVLDVNGNAYKQVKVLPNNAYKMDINKTGNVLLTYTLVGEDPLLREYAKQQNRDVQPAYTMGLQLDYSGLVVNMEYFEDIRTHSATAFEALKTKNLTEVKSMIKSPLSVTFMMNPENSTDMFTKEEICSFAYLYFMWLTDNGIFVAEEDKKP